MICNCRAHGSFLTAKGLAETAQRTSLEGLEPFGVHGVDLVRVGRPQVIEIETDYDYDSTHVELNLRSTFLQMEAF